MYLYPHWNISFRTSNEVKSLINCTLVPNKTWNGLIPIYACFSKLLIWRVIYHLNPFNYSLLLFTVLFQHFCIMCSPCPEDWGSFCLIPGLLSIIVITSFMKWWPLSESTKLEEPHRGKRLLDTVGFFSCPYCCTLVYWKGFKTPWEEISHFQGVAWSQTLLGS